MNSTFKKMVVYALPLVIILIFLNSFISYNNDNYGYPGLYISEELKGEISEVVNRKEDILGVQISSVHFQKNTRVETYTSISDKTLQAIYDKFISDRIADVPLFTAKKADNARLLRLMNGEFLCVPFSDSTAYKYAPAAGLIVKSICAIGIPPNNYDNFSGILTIYLSKEQLTPEEMNAFFLYSRELSVKIFDDNENGNKNKFRLGKG
jgi:hypothetical protein